MTTPASPLRIGNCSGFYGDRLSAAAELVEGEHIDVLTGDWLAELTMLILARRRESRGVGSGYAATFLTQMEQVLVPCLEQGIKVVSNAGGLDPLGLQAALVELSERLGVSPTIAAVVGDDVLPRLATLQASGEPLRNVDTDEHYADQAAPAISANLYLGAGAIASALEGGADVVVTGRVTDASLVVGPAAWWFGWSHTDVDALAGATVAGHLIECGAQVTGGNYAFFQDVPGISHVGFPIAELHADGTSVITKSPAAGGTVTRGTVTAQLLYEVDSPRYLGPDVVTRLDTVRLADDGHDRVRVSGVRGEPAPERLKVAINYIGGYRNTVVFVLTGLDQEAKAELVTQQLFDAIPGGRDRFDEVDVQFLQHQPAVEPHRLWQAQSELRVTVSSQDRDVVGRAFTSQAVALTLTSVPGLFLPGQPPSPEPFGVFWPTTLPQDVAEPAVHLTQVGNNEQVMVPARSLRVRSGSTVEPLTTVAPDGSSTPPSSDTMRVPLGRLVGARSGDKAGNANIGLWVRHDLADPQRAYSWLLSALTLEHFRQILPEAAELPVERYELPNLRAVNFVIRGLLGRGVAATTFLDPQAKGLGEYVRARLVELPVSLLSTKGQGDG
ncbi:MAG TPA: acyclic terpene utilization AtuA family protein [Actinomycetes bacterium]|nr:acyclic terpene utilization AtuA family protein [Actinomycetes bacterium]